MFDSFFRKRIPILPTYCIRLPVLEKIIGCENIKIRIRVKEIFPLTTA